MTTVALDVRPVTTAPPARDYLERGVTFWLIIGSFLVLTLPLSVLALAAPDLLARWYVGPVYVWLLGVTHFVLTLTIYMQSANLRYFNSTWKNRALYFAIPAAMFLFFDLYAALQIAVTYPAFDLVFRRLIRFFDFHHVTRQSFGVAQLFKGASHHRFPLWMRNTENAFFWSLTALLLLTFWSGGKFDTSERAMYVGAAVAAALFLVVVAGYLAAWIGSGCRSAILGPLTYFLLQSASAGLGVWNTSLWFFGLAMHYVEYHVLMAPRCFNVPLDPSSRVDRVFDRLRRNRWVFYFLLTAVAALVTFLVWTPMGPMLVRKSQQGQVGYLALVAVFDGLFIVHYFIEGLIWKFSNPFYRHALKPLYFGAAPSRPAD